MRADICADDGIEEVRIAGSRIERKEQIRRAITFTSRCGGVA
jgi:hypothetical protein